MSTKTSRRKFTAAFKAKVATEALQERKTLSELSKEYDIHPNMITNWKQQLLENSAKVFGEKSVIQEDKDKLIESLYKEIGSLTMDVNFLKKSCTLTSKRKNEYGKF